MMLFRIFLYACVRKIAYILVGAGLAFLLAHRAHAQGGTCQIPLFVDTTGTGCSGASAAAVAGCDVSWAEAHNAPTVSFAYSGNNCPTTVTTSGGCQANYTVSNSVNGFSANGNWTMSYSLVSGACPQNCNNLPNQDLLSTIASSSGPTQSVYCVAGCEYLNGNNTLTIGSGTNRLAGLATPSGASCGATDAPATAGNCFTSGGKTLCVDDTNQDAIVAGDVIKPSAPPAGGCLLYASGGVACTMPTGPATLQSPPAPDNGTPGQAATPDAIVTQGTTTVGYFGAAKVAGSTVSVVSTGTGPTATSNGGLGNGSGGPSTAPCPPGQTCTGTDSTSGGLDCSAPPTCSDTDPVLCGVQNQTWLLRCENPQESQLASAVNETGSIPASAAGDVSQATSESGPFSAGGANCPSPVSVTIMGKTLVLDWWSAICSFAGSISIMIMLLAYIVAARIMYVGVTGGQIST